MVRVIVNLIANAVQHTPRGGNVMVSAALTDDRSAMQFTVQGTGCGIPDEMKEAIFQKFGQVKARESTRASTGLGLPFCRMVVEAHGGRIWVEDARGEGTAFHATVPLRRSLVG